jgi:hypothetical protein
MPTTQTFDGLAFPVARVRYSNDHWNATLRRDSERTYRARTSYDHAIGGGARGARDAALRAMEKALAELDLGAGANVADYAAVPGDFDERTYVFTFVPAEILARA